MKSGSDPLNPTWGAVSSKAKTLNPKPVNQEDRKFDKLIKVMQL